MASGWSIVVIWAGCWAAAKEHRAALVMTAINPASSICRLIITVSVPSARYYAGAGRRLTGSGMLFRGIDERVGPCDQIGAAFGSVPDRKSTRLNSSHLG